MVRRMVDLLFSDGYLAGVYDAWCPRAVRDDFDFYLPRVMAADAVLDAGCGTGMMLHEARDAGHKGRLCGLDPAPGMLDRARRRGDIDWTLGELASATWEDEFDLIVMTGHAFQAIVTDAELRASLAAARRALAPAGRFAFETRNPAARAWERWTPEKAVQVIGPDGEAVRITTQVVVPFDGETVTFTHTFTGSSPVLPLRSASTLRFLDRATLADFLADAGLVVEHQFGDWNGGPLTAASPEIITIARSP
jgi:SAM-dependent methyltransferase